MDVAVSIADSLGFDYQGKHYVAAIVQFPIEEAAYVRRLHDAHGQGVKPVRPALLVVGEREAPKTNKAVPLDPQSAALQIAGLTVKDFTGAGKAQLRVDARFLYSSNGARAAFVARALLYNLPGLEQTLAVTLQLVRIVPGNVESKTRELRISDGAVGASRKKLQLVDTRTGGSEDLECKSGHWEVRDDPAWDPYGDVAYPSKKPPETFVLRALGTDKRPVPKCRIKWYRVEFGALQIAGTEGPGASGEVLTDANGEARLKLGDQLSVTLSADGYYPEDASWSAETLRDESVTVVLAPEDERVAMRVRSSLSRGWTKPTEKAEFGLDFDAAADAPKEGMVTDPSGADVWIEITRDPTTAKATLQDAGRATDYGPGPWKWRIRMRGMNGWALAAGPKTLPTDPRHSLVEKDPGLRVAPEEGYVEQLEMGMNEFPQAIFVRGAEGKRYGRIAPFEFHDDSGGRYTDLFVSFGYAVQAKPTGSRSLNPIK